MTKMTAAQARNQFADLLGQVTYAKERVTLTRRGRAVAAVIPIEDLKLLEAIEDRLDAREALKALAEPGENVTLEQLKAELGC